MGAIVGIVPTILKFYIAIRNYSFESYIDLNLGNVHDCYTVEVANDVCYLKPLWYVEATAYFNEVLNSMKETAQEDLKE